MATDFAARGIDVDNLTHVINYELPNVPETYIHRIGRTGRAGASGIAFSFCDREEKEFLRDIQKLIGKTVPVVTDHPFSMADSSMDIRRTLPQQSVQRPHNHNTRRTFGGNDRSERSERSSSSPKILVKRSS